MSLSISQADPSASHEDLNVTLRNLTNYLGGSGTAAGFGPAAPPGQQCFADHHDVDNIGSDLAANDAVDQAGLARIGDDRVVRGEDVDVGCPEP